MRFRLNTSIGDNILPEDLFRDGYKAVFVATGTGRPKRLGIPGRNSRQRPLCDRLSESPETFRLGKRVAIVGAGNVAIDAARTAIRREHSRVTILHFMGAEDMTANQDEIEMAEIDGVEFLHYTQAARIMEDAVRCVKVNRIENEDGTVSFEEDHRILDVPTDSVILAIGQGPGADLKAGSIQVTQKGLLRSTSGRDEHRRRFCGRRYSKRTKNSRRGGRFHKEGVPAHG